MMFDSLLIKIVPDSCETSFTPTVSLVQTCRAGWVAEDSNKFTILT